MLPNVLKDQPFGALMLLVAAPSICANCWPHPRVCTSVFCQSVYCQTDGGWGWRSRLRVTTCSQRELLLLPPFLLAHFLPLTRTGRRPEESFLEMHIEVCYCCRHTCACTPMTLNGRGWKADSKTCCRVEHIGLCQCAHTRNTGTLSKIKVPL